MMNKPKIYCCMNVFQNVDTLEICIDNVIPYVDYIVLAYTPYRIAIEIMNKLNMKIDNTIGLIYQIKEKYKDKIIISSVANNEYFRVNTSAEAKQLFGEDIEDNSWILHLDADELYREDHLDILFNKAYELHDNENIYCINFPRICLYRDFNYRMVHKNYPDNDVMPSFENPMFKFFRFREFQWNSTPWTGLYDGRPYWSTDYLNQPLLKNIHLIHFNLSRMCDSSPFAEYAKDRFIVKHIIHEMVTVKGITNLDEAIKVYNKEILDIHYNYNPDILDSINLKLIPFDKIEELPKFIFENEDDINYISCKDSITEEYIEKKFIEKLGERSEI